MNATSGNIHSFTYDETTRTLSVKFRNANATYHYANVPKQTYDEMSAATSTGKYFYANVRSKYKFNKA